MIDLKTYHLLLRCLAPCDESRSIFADSVRFTACGFVSSQQYSRRSELLLRHPPTHVALAERLELLLEVDTNPAPQLLANLKSYADFQQCWNGLHSYWRVGVDTILSTEPTGKVTFNRVSRSMGEDELEADNELKRNVIEQCMVALRNSKPPTSSVGEVGHILGLNHHVGTQLADLLHEAPHATLEDASGLLGCKVRTLERQLASEGLRFTELRSAVRVVEAARLLRDTDIPITDVALNSGFYDSAHFARAFRLSTDLTASQYRNLAR